jgi:hypothetical protein
LPTEIETHIDANQTHILGEKTRYVAAGQEQDEITGGSTAAPSSDNSPQAALPFVVSDAVGLQALSAVDAIINLDTIDRANADYYALATDEIEFLEAGEYLVSYSVHVISVNTAGSNRSIFETRMQEDSTASYVDVPNSFADNYLRENAVDGVATTNTQTFRVTHAAAGVKMRLLMVWGAGTSNYSTMAGRSKVTITKIG